QTEYYDAKGFTPEVIKNLARTEALLPPRGTIQRVRSIVLAESGSAVGIPLVGDRNESIESAMFRLENTAYELGVSVAEDSGALTELSSRVNPHEERSNLELWARIGTRRR
ncbi:MAG TPA: hypothetical protein VI386_07865, partial [Candidatus Sulfotelmatobacter sp.]